MLIGTNRSEHEELDIVQDLKTKPKTKSPKRRLEETIEKTPNTTSKRERRNKIYIILITILT
jgi:hypothetical protein